MNRYFLYAAAVAVFAIPSTTYAGDGAESGEKKLKLKAAPIAVQDAVKRAVGAGKLGKLTSEMEDGRTVYEAEYKLNKVEHSVKVSESGDVLEQEMEVAVSSLPAAVTAAIMQKYAGAKIEEAEQVTEGGKTFYELEVEVGDADREIAISADGSILEDKIEADDDDHEDKDGDHDDDDGDDKDKKGKR